MYLFVFSKQSSNENAFIMQSKVHYRHSYVNKKIIFITFMLLGSSNVFSNMLKYAYHLILFVLSQKGWSAHTVWLRMHLLYNRSMFLLTTIEYWVCATAIRSLDSLQPPFNFTKGAPQRNTQTKSNWSSSNDPIEIRGYTKRPIDHN